MSLNEDNVRHCINPDCNAVLKPDANFCSKCGTPQPASEWRKLQQQQPEPTTVVNQDTAKMPKSYIADNPERNKNEQTAASVSSSAGTAANSTRQISAAQAQKSGSKTLYILVAVVAILVIALSIFFIVRPLNSAQQTDQKDAQQAQSSQTAQNQPADDESASSNSNPTQNLPTISNDTSAPFWGAFAYTTNDKSDADQHATSLTNQGFTSIVVSGNDWSNLNRGPTYYVTTGTWTNQNAAQDIVSRLQSAGYSNAYAEYSGDHRDSSNTVTLTVTSASGETLSGAVHRDSNGYVLADTSNREYSTSEIASKNLSPAELCIAWNEPYARAGYIFMNPDLQAYFESTSWYTPRSNSVTISSLAESNVNRIRSVANGNSEAVKWEDLARS